MAPNKIIYYFTRKVGTEIRITNEFVSHYHKIRYRTNFSLYYKRGSKESSVPVLCIRKLQKKKKL